MALNPYGLNSVELIRKALKEFNITLEEENVEGTEIKNGGFPLSNMTTKQLCEFFATRTNVKLAGG